MKTEEKATLFAKLLYSAYKSEESDFEFVCNALPLEEESLTDDFTAMLIALASLYVGITGNEVDDLVEFTHLLNRLAIQYLMQDRSKEET